MLMRAGILFGEVVVVAVEVMVVAAVGVMSFFKKRCLSLTEVEVECLAMNFGLVGGDTFDLGGGFVAVVVEMEVDGLELEVGTVVRLVRGCLNGRLYFLWCLSRMSLQVKMPNVGGRRFGMVKWEDLFMELFFFDGGCLKNATGSKMEVVVVEEVEWVV